MKTGKVKIIDFARSRFYQDEKKDSHGLSCFLGLTYVFVFE